MDKKTLTELDYYTIRDKIAGLCVSSEGSDYIKSCDPLTDPDKIEYLKNLGLEWTAYLLSTRAPALSGWSEIETLFPIMLTDNAALSQEQAFSLGIFCAVVQKVKNSFPLEDKELEIENLSGAASSIPDLSEPAHAIYRIIDKDGKMKDLPELRSIRKRIGSLHNEIDRLIKSYTSDQALNGILESSVPVLRSDRQVLAVHANMKNRIHGIIHDVSQTGQTVYIEPDDVVLKNNELVQEEFHLAAETKSILKDLTATLKPYTDLFKQALPKMQLLDATRAAAEWGIQTHGIYPLSCNGCEETREYEPPLILQARHPLLGSRAVPVDIRFMEGRRVLIITGPNTGGKTATIKTIALFILLNQSGLPVPADEGTRLPVFDNVFADIGDDQSLDESISTFSGHMKNIGYALQNADEKSLVLLDELGSGTDPQEGGAIGMAVLDALLAKGSFVLVTTHHGILKNYGYTHPACINASVEFNTDTLSPTYHLLMGVPGESHALEIAEKNGLPESIVDQARSYIAGEQADVSELIKGLTAKHTELDHLTAEYRSKEEELKKKQLKTDLKELQLRQKKIELEKEQQLSESRFVKETRSKLENLVRELREGEITKEKTKKVKNFISDLTENRETAAEELESEEISYLHDREEADNLIALEKETKGSRKSNKNNKKHRIKNSEALASAQSIAAASDQKGTIKDEGLIFKEGAEVFAGPSKMRGILIHQERKAVWSVQIGSIKMNFNRKDLILIPPSKQPLMPSVTVDLVKDRNPDGENIKSDDKPQFCLRILGMHYEEAMKKLERQLDLCTICNVHTFCIIHGKGTGVLQQGVQDYLSHYPGVSEYHFASPEDGGTGKTWVNLK